MKHLTVLLGLLLLVACKTTQKTEATGPTEAKLPQTVEVTCILSGCQDSIRLMQFEGIYFRTLESFAVQNDTLRFSLPASPTRFVYIGKDEKDKKALIIGPESKMLLTGDCNNLRMMQAQGSATNDLYNYVMAQSRQNNASMNSAVRKLQRNFRDTEKRLASMEEVREVDRKKMALLDSVRQQSAFVARVAAIDSYQSYFTDSMGYNNEVLHYANTFFQQVDLTSADYNGIPYLFEGFKNYSQTLANIRLSKEQLIGFVDSVLQHVPSDSRAYRYALGGTTVGLQARNHPAFIEYGSRFAEKYAKDGSPAIASLSSQLEGAKSFMKGATAPDFTMNTPEDEPLSLSNLRGKVVLVDFWASWCGPCRKENPNVVRLYNKYKDQGFEVLGVSLDRQKKRWLQAIEKDGLGWKHVSDLKGWSNQAAQLYSVRSIPHTVLLDREGRIIARNLRGNMLHQELKKIFGE